MELTKNTVVLALCCGIASAAWGPSDLAVDIGDTKGDFVDLKLQWKAGSCPIAHYQVFVQSRTTAKKEVGQTTEAEFTIKNQEFWTHYQVTLETKFCFINSPLTTEIFTGPGNPHKVVSIKTETSATAANVTLVEAHMPRLVDVYNVTYCSPTSCERCIIAKNSADPLDQPVDVSISLEPLTPNTIYNISVVPEITYREKTYSGEAMDSVFVTMKE